MLLTRASFATLAVLLLLTAGGASGAALDEARAAQTEVDGLADELVRRMQELEDELHRRRVPLMAKRNELLGQIDGFWGRVIENHQSHLQWVRPGDAEMLKYLTDVRIESNEPSSAEGHKFKVVLAFKRNNFFANDEIWRVVNHAYDATEDEVSGVSWLSGNRKPWEPSFFNFFEKRTSPEHHIDRHTVNDIAHVLRYEVWANPFTYHDLPTFAELAAQQHAYDAYNPSDDGEPAHEAKSPEEAAADAATAHAEALRALEEQRAARLAEDAEKQAQNPPHAPSRHADGEDGGKPTPDEGF